MGVRSNWSKIGALIAGAALVFAVGSSAATYAQAPRTLTVAVGADIDAGDPAKSTGLATIAVLANVYDRLVRRDAALNSNMPAAYCVQCWSSAASTPAAR